MTVPVLGGSERKLALLVTEPLDRGLLDHGVDCEEEEDDFDVK